MAANLTSTLLKFHVAPKLESILDKESKITHDMFAAQIETRLGSGEGNAAKGPDMKVWGKGKGLESVSDSFHILLAKSHMLDSDRLAFCRILLSTHHHLEVLKIRIRSTLHGGIIRRQHRA